MDYFWVFLVGGVICVIAQLLMDITKMTSAEVLVIFITAGVVLSAIGIYEPLVELGKAGATVPLPGFGYALAKGVFKAVDEMGLIGAFVGGTMGTAGGIAAAIFFGYIMAILFDPKTKK